MLHTLQTNLRTAAMAASVAAIGATSAAAQDVRIGAMSEGSSWYVFAATLEQIIEPILGAHSVEVIARGGGIANPMVVQGGSAEIALSNRATAVWAQEGNDVYDGMAAPDIQALVGGLNDVYVGVMAREAFLEQRGTRDLAEILQSDEPIRVLMKPVGSSAVPAAHMIFESLGTSVDEIKSNGGDVVQVDTAQIADQLRNGNADIYVDTMIKGHPTISEVSLTANVAFLDLPQVTQDFLSENGLTIGTYGPWFEGQDEPTVGANLGTVLIAHATVDEETAYQITKALVENVEALKSSNAAWAEFDPSTAMLIEQTGIPLHPGAERYYREAGMM
jgi:uncharacterized protein